MKTSHYRYALLVSLALFLCAPATLALMTPAYTAECYLDEEIVDLKSYRSHYLVDDDLENIHADFYDLQEAIDFASSGESIVICPGVYEPIDIDKDLKLSGAGRDSSAVVIDGGFSERVVEIDDSRVIMRNVEIRNGLITGLPFSSGGGMHMSNSSVHLYRINFIDNLSDGTGGAIQALASDVHIENSHFNGNEAADHGGAILFSDELGVGNLTVVNNLFTENKAFFDSYVRGNNGGAIYSFSSGDVNISGNQFEANLADNGAAIYLEMAGVVTLADNHFESNVAEYSGAAIYSYAVENLQSNHNVFLSNLAASKGGAIYLRYSSYFGLATDFLSENDLIERNEADSGGGIYTEPEIIPSFYASSLNENDPENCVGFFVDLGLNTDSDGSCF